VTQSFISGRTLRQCATLSGEGLHSGRNTTVRIGPAKAGNGIRFVRTDLPGRPVVSIQDVDRNSPPFRTVIKRQAAEVHTIEHLLSALAGLGITDCEIEIDGLEVPGADGSALPFVEAIYSAGIVNLESPNTPLVVREPLCVEDGSAKIQALPHAGEFKISYTLHYPGHTLAQGSYEIVLSEESYLREIAPARTFAIKKDAEAMRAAGLGRGANFQNTCIIDGDQVLETTLRFKDEPVRHKILDLIGDLYVLRRPIHAHIIATCSGHRTNAMLAAKLAELTTVSGF